MTKKEKELLFEELITIRSGLSLIFENQNKIGQLNTEIDNTKAEINNLENELATEKKTLTYHYNLMQKIVKSNIKYIIGFIVSLLSLLVLPIVLIGVLGRLLMEALDTMADPAPTVVLFFLGTGAIVLVVILSIKGIIKNKRALDRGEIEVRNHQDGNDTGNAKVDEIIKKLDELQSKCNLDDENALVPANLHQIDVLYNQNLTIYNLLRKEHNSIVHEADWPYIDLIAHYIETGRSETLKDALLRVDEQVRADQLTNAIQSAAQYVSQSFSYALSSLETTINSKFTLITNKINNLSNNIEDIKSINSSLTKEINLQESLINNLKTSSSDLAKAANKISKETRNLEDEIRYEFNKIS